MIKSLFGFSKALVGTDNPTSITNSYRLVLNMGGKMRRTILNATAAFALVLAQSSVTPAVTSFFSAGALLATYNSAYAQDLSTAKANVAAAKAALKEAKAKNEGIEQARQALDAAISDLTASIAQAKAVNTKTKVEEQSKSETAKKAKVKDGPKTRAVRETIRENAPVAEGKKVEAKTTASELNPPGETHSDTGEPRSKKEARQAPKAARKMAADAEQSETAEKQAKKSSEKPAEEAPIVAVEPTKPSANPLRVKPTAGAPIDKEAADAAERMAADADQSDTAPKQAEKSSEKPAEDTPVVAAEPPKPSANAPEAKPVAETPIDEKAAKAARKQAADSDQSETAPKQAEKPTEKPAEEEPVVAAEPPKPSANAPRVKPTAEAPIDKEAADAAKKKAVDAAQSELAPIRTGKSSEKPAEEAPVAAVEPPKPSANAPEAKPIAEAPIEKQIQEASKTPAAVLPDNVSKVQQDELRAAEERRREEARENREKLLGVAAVGAVIGALIPALGGTVVEDEGDRFVVERDGEYHVRKDDSALFRNRGENIEIEKLRNGKSKETIYQRNGSEIVTVRNAGGYVLRRVVIRPNGERDVLFDVSEEQERRIVDYDRDLPPIRIGIPEDEYIVSGGRHDRRDLAEILEAPPVERVTVGYTLREIRENDRLRSMVRRVDLDTITFDSNSATVRTSQVPYLADIAGGMLDVIDRHPGAIFMIEGHTDAVGPEVTNLTLSDRRAETVARILVEAYDMPPENLIVQGYGEQYLKIETDGDERRNRRVTVRNITPLLSTSSN